MTPKLERTVLRARLALFWERLWAAAYPLLMVLAVFTMAVLTGILAALPDLIRYAALAALALALLWALRPLLALAFPWRSEGLRRIERASFLDHRPVSAVEDKPANPSPERAGGQAHEHAGHAARRRRAHLSVGPTGAKSWIYRYRRNGRLINIGLGPLLMIASAMRSASNSFISAAPPSVAPSSTAPRRTRP